MNEKKNCFNPQVSTARIRPQCQQANKESRTDFQNHIYANLETTENIDQTGNFGFNYGFSQCWQCQKHINQNKALKIQLARKQKFISNFQNELSKLSLDNIDATDREMHPNTTLLNRNSVKTLDQFHSDEIKIQYLISRVKANLDESRINFSKIPESKQRKTDLSIQKANIFLSFATEIADTKEKGENLSSQSEKRLSQLQNQVNEQLIQIQKLHNSVAQYQDKIKCFQGQKMQFYQQIKILQLQNYIFKRGIQKTKAQNCDQTKKVQFYKSQLQRQDYEQQFQLLQSLE